MRFRTSENCKEIIYNNQAANADIDSSNHRDYQRYNASPPVRVRKKLSAKLLLGQDGDPTYLSTSTEAFQNYSLPFNQRSKLADGVNQQEDHIILGSNSARSASRMLSTNHADYLKYDMLQRQKPSHVNYLNDSGFVFGSDDPQYLTSSQAQFDSKRLQRRLSQENLLTTEQVDKRKQHDLFRSSSGLLFGGGAQSARSAAVTATQQTLARKVAAERPAAGFTKSPLNYMDQTKELFPGGDQQNVERNHVSQKLAFDPDRPAAGLNRNGLGQKDKSAIVFGEDGRQWNATTTSAEAFKRQNQSNSAAAGMATVPRRDLFQMSDGFMLGQDGQESPRYSSAAGRRSRKISQKTKDRLRRLLAAQDNGDGVDPLENYDDLLEMYNYYKQNSRMGKSEKNAGSEWSPRESRSRRSRHTEATGGASVPESAYADAASSNRSRLTPMSLAQLQEELRSLREANQDANEQGGLLWFPIANENNGKQRRKVETKDLPKWAEDALKEAPVQPDEYQKQITRLAATNIAQEALATKNISHANAAGTKSLQDRDSSADRLTNIAGFEGTEGSRRKKQSIPSSSDEGLVMDNSLRESPRSQINQRNQNRPPAGLPSRQKPTSIFASDQTEEKAGLTRNSSRAAGSYPDSIESGRQSSRMWRSDTERGDSLDSLQSRRVSPRIELESPTTADYTRREMYLNKKGRVPRSASVEEAIRGNTTKIRVPKLIPVNRAEDDDDGDNGALTESNAQEANSGLSAEKEEIGRMGSTFKPGSPTSVARPISVSKSKKKKETAVKDTAPSLPEEPISKTDQQRTRENGKSDPLQQNDAKENMAETTDFQDNKRAVKMAAAAAAAGTMASILTHPDQSQSLTAAKIKRKKQRSSSTESAAGLRSRISPDQQVASIPPAADHENVRTSSGNRRKGRRAVAKDKSQYPRATSLAGLLKQGFLEQTTTSNDAFPPHDKSDFSRSRSARQRNTETANFKDAIFPVTSRPVQRTPPTTANPTNGWPAATTPILRSPRMASSRLLPDADPTSTPPLESAMRLEHFRQKRQLASKGPQERLPDGYERTQPIRYPDNLAFDTSGKFLDRSSNNHDYQGLQPDQPLRIQSLDRKQLRSQIGDLLYSPAADDRFRPRLDDVERVRAPSLEEGFHAGDQRRSLIVHKDHDIFQNKDKFTSTTEAGDAFQLPAAGQDARRRLLRPKSQQDLLGRKQGSLSATGPSRSVSQEAYQNVGNVAFDRAQPFKPETQLHLFDRTNIMTGNSVSQDAYQNASGTAIGRVKSFKPEANLPLFDSTNHVTGNSVSHEAYQSAGNLPFDRAQPFKPETQLHLFNSTNHVTGKSVSQDSFNNSGNAAVDRVQPFKPETNLPLFDTTNHVTGHSVSQDAYQKADHNVVDRVHPFKPENNLTLFDSTNHVTGHSVSRDTYQNGAAVPFDQVQAFRPQTELSLFDKQHLTGSSISHEAYSAHGGQPIERRHPIRPKSALKLFNSNPNSASNSAKRRRQSISFSQNSLPPLVPSANQNRLARLKMTQSRNDSHQSFQSHSKDPFSQSTTSYDDYANPGHDPPPALIRQNSGGVFYQSNGQHMSDVTTSGLAFVRPPTGNSRIKPVLPRRSSFFDPATGDKVVQSTTNQDYYAPHDALPPIRTHSQPPTRADSANLLYHRSNITSTAPPQSTNQEHFKTFNIEGIGRRHPAKNQQIESAINPLTGNVRVFANGDRSRTAVDHNAESDVCPAALLQAGAKSWKFLGNEAGHLFFDLDT